MIQDGNIWLTIEEACRLTGEITETVRRKCKTSKYTATAQKVGKCKIYSVLLSSLPKEAQDKYFTNNTTPKVDLIVNPQNSIEYAQAPEWARKQADKYLELISRTEKMTHSQIDDFLKIWNQK